MLKENYLWWWSKTALSTNALLFTFLSITLLCGCAMQKSKDTSIGTKPLSGIWRSLSGDVYVEFNNKDLSYFEVTYGNKVIGSKPTCLSIEKVSATEDFELSIPSNVNDFTVTSKNSLNYQAPGDLFPHTLFRSKNLPTHCETPLIMSHKYQHRPAIDFDIFWNNLSENYAFFGLRGISQHDWEQVYLQYRLLALEAEDQKALFTIFSQIMAETFSERIVNEEYLKGDGHVVLTGGKGLEWEHEASSSKGYSRGRTLLTNPAKSYLSERFDQSAFEPLSNQGAIWGIYSYFAKLKSQSTGYLLLNSMVDYHSEKDINVSIDDFHLQEIAVKKWMDKVIKTAQQHNLNKIIIDIRNNMGGYDKTSLQIASYFTNEAKVILSKQSRTGGDIDTPLWSKKKSVSLEPNSRHFSGKVVVLTSQHTISASETFAMAMSQLPNVRLVGESTAGSLSDILQKHSSNGWLLSLSHQIYKYPNNDSLNYSTTPEARGVTPDIEMPYNPISLYSSKIPKSNKVDHILEKAESLEW